MPIKSLKVLFIGNSHTYYNDMPFMVKQRAVSAGYNCHVTMIAHPGWYLEQHVQEPEVRYNILYGEYDYIVIQEHAHPFGPEEKFEIAAKELNALILEAGSTAIIYECWAKKDEPEKQKYMNEVHHQIAEEINALIAPVGENWWEYVQSWPEIDMYAEDGAHASPAGSDFAAKYIWDAIERDMVKSARKAEQ